MLIVSHVSIASMAWRASALLLQSVMRMSLVNARFSRVR
jgi:hypothetical protein